MFDGDDDSLSLLREGRTVNNDDDFGFTPNQTIAAGVIANSLDLLSLRENKLDMYDIRRLRRKLLYGVQIKHLDISDNMLGNKGVKYLCEYLEDNVALQQLSLCNNEISEKGALRTIELFNSCPNLQKINLSGNEKMSKIV